MLRLLFAALSALVLVSQAKAAEIWKCSLDYKVAKHEVRIYITDEKVWFENAPSTLIVLKNTHDLAIAYYLSENPKTAEYLVFQRSTGILTEIRDANSQILRAYAPDEAPEITNGTCSKAD
jgi:hypothetical protein